MQEMVMAIDGQVVMTPQLVEAIDFMYNNRVPREWQYDPTGVEISWITPSLGSWMSGLYARYSKLKLWLEKDSPASFWLPGFQRPQAFLTAVKQTVARQRRAVVPAGGGAEDHAERWALDNVDYYTEVQKEEIKTADGSLDGKFNKQVKEGVGVFIHGLFMEGAQWNKQGNHLEESEAKDLKTLFKDFPVMWVLAETKMQESNKPGAKGGGGRKSFD